MSAIYLKRVLIAYNIIIAHHCPTYDHLQNTQLQQISNFTLSGTPASNNLCTHPPLPVPTTGLTSPQLGFTGTAVPSDGTQPKPATGPTFPP